MFFIFFKNWFSKFSNSICSEWENIKLVAFLLHGWPSGGIFLFRSHVYFLIRIFFWFSWIICALQECIPDILDELAAAQYEGLQLNCLNVLINLTVLPQNHVKFPQIAMELLLARFDTAAQSTDTEKLQSLKVLVNLSCNDESIPRLLNAKVSNAHHRLIDWSINWLVDWLVGWLIDWLIGWLVDWLIGWVYVSHSFQVPSSFLNVYLNPAVAEAVLLRLSVFLRNILRFISTTQSGDSATLSACPPDSLGAALASEHVMGELNARSQIITNSTSNQELRGLSGDIASFTSGGRSWFTRPVVCHNWCFWARALARLGRDWRLSFLLQKCRLRWLFANPLAFTHCHLEIFCHLFHLPIWCHCL